VFRSGKGDCLLVTGADGKRMLVDGGVFDAYEDHWAREISEIDKLDVVCISHIHRDHIGGILRMFDNEVGWRIHDFQQSLPAGLRSSGDTEPDLPRPPAVDAVWHNAFFEETRENIFTSSVAANRRQRGIDMARTLARSAAILAGQPPGTPAYEAAQRNQFLAQSVGDAIQVSRRIGASQLGIAVNPDYGGDFMVRKSDGASLTIGGMGITVLGPTSTELKKLLKVWNDWIDDHTSHLADLLRRHEDEAGRLPANSPQAVLNVARDRAAELQAIALAGNQTVTPPNLASLILLVEEAGKTVLMTGDADDPTIIEGLEKTGKMAGGGHFHVNVLKVPHHGAHNSYSDEFARRVTADNYVFCGDGEHHNPEPDVIDGYLEVLFNGRGGHPPALADNAKVKFWFNGSEQLSKPGNMQLWKDVDAKLDLWKSRQSSRFFYRRLTSGQSFTIDL
ncbi:MAG: MBL fold metallo-hydrolase, partial [Aestuariivirgaceae bacterium]